MDDEHRLVLDTNTLISRLLLPKGVAGRAVDKALAEGIILASDDTLQELAQVIRRPKFDRYLSLEERRHFMTLLGGVVRLIPITHRVAVCRDPKDDIFLHVALNGEAHILITGDQDLLVLADSFQRRYGLHILSPSDYLARQ